MGMVAVNNNVLMKQVVSNVAVAEGIFWNQMECTALVNKQKIIVRLSLYFF